MAWHRREVLTLQGGSRREFEEKIIQGSIRQVKSESSGNGPALVHRRGSLRGTLVTLSGMRVSIGRDRGSDVHVGSGVVSSHHALLVFDREKDAGWFLRDLDSKNGTYLNGRKVVECRLEDGDVIRLCRDGPEFVFAARGSIDYMSDSTVCLDAGEFTDLTEPERAVEAESVKGVCRVLGREIERSSRRSRRVVLLSAAAVCLALLLGAWHMGGDPLPEAGSLVNLPAVELELDPVYTSLFHSYRDSGIGTARVVNTTSKVLAGASLDFTLEGEGKAYLVEGLSIAVPELSPGEKWELPLKPLLSRNIVTERSFELTAVASLRVAGEVLSSANRAVSIYDYHVFNWQDPRKVAVFVDSNDAAVKAFVDSAWEHRPRVSQYEFPPPRMVTALTLLSALNGHRIGYKPDARTPVSVSAGVDNSDRINYPGETLLRRSGDCDDAVVLCCSILEAADIPTAVVVDQKHVIMMFDSGLSAISAGSSKDPGETGNLFCEESWVAYKGRLWIPVEATELARSAGGFAAAWAAAWHYKDKIESGEMQVIEIREGWKSYKPLHPPPAEDVLAKIRDSAFWRQENLAAVAAASIQTVKEYASDNLNAAVEELKTRCDGLELAQRSALLYTQAGFYKEAVRLLEEAVFGGPAPASPQAVRSWGREVTLDLAILLTDLALAVTLSSSTAAELEQAVEYYGLALTGLPEALPEKSECMLRLGLVHKMRGDLKAYREWTSRAIKREPRLRETLDRLERGDGRVASSAPGRDVLDYLRAGMAVCPLGR